ncbi:MAG: beta galactosidase jelly roll domain-containing protein [Bacteroidota bacterium]|nr:beta galactosidase jelly roll domain-containing protein [Bacteroidota bacterium]
MQTRRKYELPVLILALLSLGPAIPLPSGDFLMFGQGLERILDLRGTWRFAIGDDSTRALPAFDDSGWDRIQAPGAWEDQGYPGYDGWAWYRRQFTVDSRYRFDALYLHLGNIDDVDEVYINGRFTAFQGLPPPSYISAFAEKRWYYVPYEYLNFSGPNIIAVRVYDRELSGGIIRGNLGLYHYVDYLVPDQSLRGTWKLRRGDLPEWKDSDVADTSWPEAFVPACWETQGLKDYDGFGWYRRRFTLDPALRNEALVLLLGKIDDVDEVWLNGVRVGKTGRMPTEGGRYINDDAYDQLRAYELPPGIVHGSGENVIAVRVFDGFMHGGICEGPVGLIRRERLRAWYARHPRNEKSPFRRLIDALFGD